MGTKKDTQQTAQFDPGSKALFGQLTGALGPMLTGYMNNPFGNPFFQTQQQMGTHQAQQLGGTQMSNLLRNLTSSGLMGGASSPAALEMLQNQSRANTGLQSQLGFLNPVQNALGMQQWAGGLGAQYRPLQTGQHTTEATSGLGTWLPQVAGMGLSALTGGLGGLFGGAAGALGGLPTSLSAGQLGNLGGLMASPLSGSGFAGTNMFGEPGMPISPFTMGTPPPPPSPWG